MNNTNFRVVVRRMNLENLLYWRPEFIEALTGISKKIGYKPESRTTALTMVFTNILKGEGMGMERRDIGLKAALATIDVMDNGVSVESAVDKAFIDVEVTKAFRAFGLVNQYINARKLEVSKPNIHRALKNNIGNDNRELWG